MVNYIKAVEGTKPELIYTISGQDEFNALRFLTYPRALHVSSLERNDLADMPFRLWQLEPFNEARTANTPDVLDQIESSVRFKCALLLAPYRIAKQFISAAEAKLTKPSYEKNSLEVCFVGRFETYLKRVHWIPEIIKDCTEAGRPFQWHLYGAGPAERDLRIALQENGQIDRVHFHGWLDADQLVRQLRYHDLFFLCSRSEGLPIAMIEAMLCGQACVVPAINAGITFVLSNGGGWLYKASSPRSCAAALVAATANRGLLNIKREEAQRVARDLFAPENVERELVKLERALCSLQFNGRVLAIDRARKFRNVPIHTSARRRILQIGEALRKRWQPK
jgi:glycosyltransferase involved in cell wall biosynthesis